MISDRAYLRLFQTDNDILTQSEIQRILDEELAKNDPDTELIGYCLDALEERKTRPAAAAKLRRFSVRTAVAAAAVFLVLVGSATAAASFLDIDLFGPLVRLYNDRIRIGHSGESGEGYALTDTPLAKTLAENGIGPVLLPEALTDGTYAVDSVQFETTELIRSADIRFSAGKTKGILIISVYAEGAALPVTDYAGAKDAVVLQTERISCCVFSQGGGTVVDFSDGSTVYSIILNGGRETAVALAETIR